MEAGQGHPLALLEQQAILSVGRVVGVMIEDAGADEEVSALTGMDGVPLPVEEGVSGEGDAARPLEVDVRLLAADDVPGDADQARLVPHFGAVANHADVRPAGGGNRLNGVARDGHLAHAARARLDPDIGGDLCVAVEVVLDIVAGDLQVADLALPHLDATAPVVADV